MDSTDPLDDYDSDSVSLTSTVASTVGSNKEYVVDRILAELEGDGNVPTEYLIRWDRKKYSLLESSWGTADDFDEGTENITLKQWGKRKLLEEQGVKERFDLERFDAAVQARAHQTELRRARRAAKKERIHTQGQRAALSRLGDSILSRPTKVTVPPPVQSGIQAVAPTPSFDANLSDELFVVSDSDLESEHDSSNLDRPRKRKLCSSPASGEKKKNAAKAAHTRGVAQRARRSVSDSPKLPSSPDSHVSDLSHNLSQTNRKRLQSAKNGKSETSIKDLAVFTNEVIMTSPKEKMPPLTSPESGTGPGPMTKGIAEIVTSLPQSVPISAGQSTTKQTANAVKPPHPVNQSGNLSVVNNKPSPRSNVSFEQALANASIRAGKSVNSTTPASATGPSPPVSAFTPVNKAPLASKKTAATSGATARRTGTNILNRNWDENKKRDVRKSRLQSSTTMNQGDARFKNLSIQNNVQKWTARERAPDLNALSPINLQTGKLEDVVQANRANGSRPPASMSGLRVNTNVGTQDQTNRNGGVSSMSAPDSRSTLPQDLSSSARLPHDLPLTGKKGTTCPFWKKGKCNRSAEGCEYAHANTGRIMQKKLFSCYWYNNGGCKYSAEVCLFIHGPQTEEEGNGTYFERQYGRREESPDASGLRQDEVDRVRKQRRVSDATSLPALASTTFTGASLQQRQAPSQLSRRGQVITAKTSQSQPNPPSAPESRRTSLSSHEQVLDAIETPLAPGVVAESDKMSLDASTLVSEMSANLHIESHDNHAHLAFQVKLLFDPHSRHEIFIETTGDNADLKAQKICLAKDFHQFCFENDQMWTSGDVVHTGDPATVAAFESLEEYLVTNAAGAIIRQEKFLMVVYPIKTGSWDFLGKQRRSDSILRFHVQSAMTSEYEIGAQAQDTPTLADICKKELGLDSDRIFGGLGKTLDKNVFLMFPSRMTPEVQILTAYLLSLDATVYHADVPGSWDLYKTRQDKFNKTGVVLFHPSMDQYWHIPDFHLLLHGGHYNFFQLGIDPSLTDESGPVTKYSCTRLFPQGGLLFITDDVLEFHPKAAAQILEMFFEETDRKAIGLKNDRVLTRPDLRAWLLDLVDKYAAEDKAKNNTDRLRLYVAASNLLPDSVDVETYPFNADPPLLISPRLAELPNYPKKWDQDEESAIDYLVEWFAGWCLFNREEFRRFTVVHEQHRKVIQTPGQGPEKDPRGWSKRFGHLKVMNCERWFGIMKEKKKSNGRTA